MQIYVKTLGGKDITIDIEPDDTIATLKQRVQDKEGLRPEQQHFVYGRKSLAEADRTLANYGVLKETTVHLVGRLHA